MGQALRRASGKLRTSAGDKSPAPPQIKNPVGPTPPAVPFDKVSGGSDGPDKISKCVFVCVMIGKLVMFVLSLLQISY